MRDERQEFTMHRRIGSSTVLAATLRRNGRVLAQGAMIDNPAVLRKATKRVGSYRGRTGTPVWVL